MKSALIPLCLAIVPLCADGDVPGRRILAADDSTHLLAIIRPDGFFERVDSIHNAQLLPN